MGATSLARLPSFVLLTLALLVAPAMVFPEYLAALFIFLVGAAYYTTRDLGSAVKYAAVMVAGPATIVYLGRVVGYNLSFPSSILLAAELSAFGLFVVQKIRYPGISTFQAMIVYEKEVRRLFGRPIALWITFAAWMMGLGLTVLSLELGAMIYLVASAAASWIVVKRSFDLFPLDPLFSLSIPTISSSKGVRV